MIKIISEIGIVHNGDLNLVKNDPRVKNLADLVKFQRDLDLVYSKEVLDQKRESPWGNTTRSKKVLNLAKGSMTKLIIFVKRLK